MHTLARARTHTRMRARTYARTHARTQTRAHAYIHIHDTHTHIRYNSDSH